MGGIPLTPFLTYREEQSQSLICIIFYILHFNNYHGATAAVGQGPLIIKDS